MWAAKAKSHTAFKVIRYIKKRNAYRLSNEYGAVFEVAKEKLDSCGYKLISSKPSYAKGATYNPLT